MKCKFKMDVYIDEQHLNKFEKYDFKNNQGVIYEIAKENSKFYFVRLYNNLGVRVLKSCHKNIIEVIDR